MNQSKRKALKAIGATSIAASVGTMTPWISASAAKATSIETPQLPDQFSIHIEHKWGGQDARVVIKNSSNHRATITNITPSFISAEPGLFDFSVVTKHGVRSLDAQEDKDGHSFRRPMVTHLSKLSRQINSIHHILLKTNQTIDLPSLLPQLNYLVKYHDDQ